MSKMTPAYAKALQAAGHDIVVDAEAVASAEGGSVRSLWSLPGVAVAATVEDFARYEGMRAEFFFDLY